MTRSASASQGGEHAAAGDGRAAEDGRAAASPSGQPASETCEIAGEDAGREAYAAAGPEGDEDEPGDDEYVPL